ncbi:MAG: DUF2127 domain-containing protein [Tahibacter sp.]
MSRSAHAPRMLAWIAAFKLLKSLLLLVLALTAFGLLRDGVLEQFVAGVQNLPLAPGSHLLARLLDWAMQLTPHRIKIFGVVMLVYSTVLCIEGVGLWRAQAWAEYLTVIATSSLIPFELYEIFHHPTPLKFGALVVNVAIVMYLIRLLRRERH